MLHLDSKTTAAVAIDMHRGHLDPAVATLPLHAERCGPVIKRAAALFDALRQKAVPVIHVVTEYRDPGEIGANPFWKSVHDDPAKGRRGILRHNLAGSPGTESSPSSWTRAIWWCEARSGTACSMPPTSRSSCAGSAWTP